ncbi:unnamed protein product [Arabidopsis halleri]
MVVRFWNPKVWAFGGKIDDPKEFKEELKEIEVSCNSDIECLVSDYGNSELMTEALGFVLRCANRSFSEEKLTKHKFRNKERSITKKENNGFNNLLASKALVVGMTTVTVITVTVY